MAISGVKPTRPETPADVLVAARARRRAADAAEADLLQLAVDWAVMHPADAIHQPATHVLRGFGQTDLALAGAGAPTVAEYSVAEFASAVGLSTEAGGRYLGEALEQCYRLPRHWARVTSGEQGGATCSCNVASRWYVLHGRTHMPVSGWVTETSLSPRTALARVVRLALS